MCCTVSGIQIGFIYILRVSKPQANWERMREGVATGKGNARQSVTHSVSLSKIEREKDCKVFMHNQIRFDSSQWYSNWFYLHSESEQANWERMRGVLVRAGRRDD